MNDEPDLGRARCKGGTLYRENVRGGVLEHKKAGQTAFKYAEFFRNCASRSRSLLLRSRGSPPALLLPFLQTWRSPREPHKPEFFSSVTPLGDLVRRDYPLNVSVVQVIKCRPTG